MQLEFFSTWTQGKGNCPLPLQPIPKNNNNNNKTKNNTNINPKNNTNINNKTEAVYTEGLTHPTERARVLTLRLKQTRPSSIPTTIRVLSVMAC